jgi:LPXTG-motif cell wall-anchored protein
MIRGTKIMAAAFAALLSLVVLTTAAQAQTYDDQPTVSVDRPVVVQGESATITGTGWDPACEVVLSYGGGVIGSAVVNPDGTFSFVWNTAGVPLGLQTVTVFQECTGQSLQVQVTVVAQGTSVTPATPGTTGTLPRTGSDTGVFVRGGLALLALGGLALVVSRRWRQGAATA